MMMGIVDICYKIIKRGAEHEEDLRRLADLYEEEFCEDMADLNIMPPTVVTKVTNFVPQITIFVETIIDKRQGYSTEDGKFQFMLFVNNSTQIGRWVNVQEVCVFEAHREYSCEPH